MANSTRYRNYSQADRTGQQRSRGNSPRSGAAQARKLLYWLAVLVAAIVALANIVPYVYATEFLLTELFSLQGLWASIGNRLLDVAAWPIGFILWGFIQTAETYPILLKHDRRLMRLIAMEADQADYLEIRDNDDPALVKMKEWYNKFPSLTIRSANRVMLVAYVIDTAICLSVFPPVEGGFRQLFFVLFTGQWGLIEWESVALIVVMLFCFEMMVRLVLFLGLQAYYLRRAHA